jgi:hypothetical protein
MSPLFRLNLIEKKSVLMRKKTLFSAKNVVLLKANIKFTIFLLESHGAEESE